MQSDKANGQPYPIHDGPRAANGIAPGGVDGTQADIVFEGLPIQARIGETLASALSASGQLVLRRTPAGAERGVFCGMGVCRDCLVDVGERRNVRACMTKVELGMQVRRAGAGGSPWVPSATPSYRVLDSVAEDNPDILVIGAGPAGLAAALAARHAGARVVLADERSRPGGQFFKQASAGAPIDQQQDEGRQLVERVVEAGVEIWSDTLVWGGFESLEFAVNRGGGTLVVRPRAAIYAGGAYERSWAVPGWTLPGVMTTGAAQTMWRSDRRLAGRRVAIAGNGPLNLQLAAELAGGGAEVVAVVESAPAPRSPLNAARMLASAPGLVVQGLKYLAACRRAGILVYYGSYVDRIVSTPTGLEARVAGARERTLNADIVCLGYGFWPSNELLRAMGARTIPDVRTGSPVLVRDAVGETSIPGLFAIGDCTGLNGARVALAEGTLAGAAAARRAGFDAASTTPQRKAFASLRRHRRFQRALWSLYRPTVSNVPLPADTIVCRCEEISLGDIRKSLEEGYRTAGSLKQRTRIGMGHCQGRYCGAVLSNLLPEQGQEFDEFAGFAPRLPVKPITIGSLAADPAE